MGLFRHERNNSVLFNQFVHKSLVWWNKQRVSRYVYAQLLWYILCVRTIKRISVRNKA